MAGSVLSSRRGIGGLVVMLGGALMVASVWLPWLDTQADDPTGWDTYTALTDAGRNGFYEGSFFNSGFSPLFSGLSVLIVGCVFAVIGLAMILALRRTPPIGVRLAMILVGMTAMIVAGLNLLSLLRTGPGSGIVDPALGMYLAAAGGFVGLLGVALGVAPDRT